MESFTIVAKCFPDLFARIAEREQKDALPKLFDTMNRAFSAPIPDGKSCQEIIDDAMLADSDAQARAIAHAVNLADQERTRHEN